MLSKATNPLTVVCARQPCHILQALVFVYLSWTDPRAREAVANNTARLARNSSEACKMQCQLYPQNQPNPATGCCDNVWVRVCLLPAASMGCLHRWQPPAQAVCGRCM